MNLLAGQNFEIKTKLAKLSDQEIKYLKIVSDLEQVMSFAKFVNNSRFIRFAPVMKDIGVYYATLNITNLVIGDV